MCGLPGRLPRRPDRRRPRRARGPEARRRDPGVQRRLPRPAAAARRRPRRRRVIVALRALRGGAADETREVVDRALAKLEAAAAEAAALAARSTRATDAAGRDLRPAATCCRTPRRGRQVRLDLLRAGPRRGVRAGGRPARRRAPPQAARLPRRLVPQRRGARLFRLDRIARGRGARRARSRPTRRRPRDLADGLFGVRATPRLVTLRLEPEARWVGEYYPVEAVRELGRRPARGRPAGGRRALAEAAAAAARPARHRGARPPARETFTAAAQLALSLYD